jgi:glycerol-3-phosphate dehydrogenase
LTGKQIFLSKGVHVVVPRERLPIRHAVYFDIPDGRMLFAIPRHRITYIGTTDTPYQGDRDQVFADAADVDYILEGTNQMFPSAKLNTADVESTWAGLRPLIFETGKSAGEMSRKDEIFSSPTGLISIAGGKLTGYRKMAARVVDLVMRNRVAEGLDTFRPCETHRIPLLAGEPLTAASLPLLRETIRQKVRSEDLPDFHTDYLLENYGPDAVRILSDMSSYDDLRPDTRLLRAELQHAIRHEWVLEPADFLERRTGRLYFHIRSIEDNLPVILADMGRLLSWTAEKAAAAESDIRELVRRVKVFG